MKESERIEVLLSGNDFVRGENLDEWSRGRWTVRFFEDEMEIYENPDVEGHGRYLLTEIDADTLEEVLEDM